MNHPKEVVAVNKTALSAALEAEAKRLGYRSIMGLRWQSWGGFTSHLYGGDRRRGEFDEATFVFLPGAGLEETKDAVVNDHTSAFQRSDSLDKESLVSGYFGRPIKHSEFTFSYCPGLAPPLTDDKRLIAEWAERALEAIQKTALPHLYKGEPSHVSTPALVLHRVELRDPNEITVALHAYYLWEFQPEATQQQP